MGLGDRDVGTFPSHPPNIVMTEGGGFWKGLAVAGLASAGIGAGLIGYLNPLVQKKTDTVFEIEILGTEDGVKVNSVKEVDGP